MNAAFQFALARSSGHSEDCHHIKLIQPRVNAVRQIWHSGLPKSDSQALPSSNFNCFSAVLPLALML